MTPTTAKITPKERPDVPSKSQDAVGLSTKFGSLSVRGQNATLVIILIAVGAVIVWQNYEQRLALVRGMEAMGKALGDRMDVSDARHAASYEAIRSEHRDFGSLLKQQQSALAEQTYILALPPNARPELTMPDSLRDKIRAWPNAENRRR